MKELLSPKEAAAYLSVSINTMRNYAIEGKVAFERTPGGQRRFRRTELDRVLGREPQPRSTAFYVRSSNGNEQSMDSQTKRLSEAYGAPSKVFRDKASGLNEKRKGLRSLMESVKKRRYDRVCITASDRLTRFGITYLIDFFSAYDCSVVILDDEVRDKSIYDELMGDFMSLLASFSGKFYKIRSIEHERRLLERASAELDDEEK